ncbi:hypothetical protein [Fluviicola taffensis]|uniref:hypothetical protein n=1 Tax=Fluviicola taffensis TaxID=191579 RepID=UPI003137B18F
MLLSPTTFDIIRFGTGIILFAGCFYLIKQRLESKKKTVISIIAGIIGFSAVQFTCSKIYLIDKDLVYEQFYLIGSTKQQLGNGKTISVSSSRWDRANIVNKSEFKLILEEIIYTDNVNNVSANGDYEIVPYSSLEVFLPTNEITYFFEDNIPDAVEVRGESSKKQYWLRLESEAGNNE